ncbi:4-hydroxybutyrate CoA-transferase [Desulfarculales bacterium]
MSKDRGYRNAFPFMAIIYFMAAPLKGFIKFHKPVKIRKTFMPISYWPDDYATKKRTPAEAIRQIKWGQRVFITSSCGEPQCLVRHLAAQSCNFTDVEIVRVMSLETAPLTMIAEKSACQGLNVRYFYLGSAKGKTLALSKRFLTPINLSAVPRLFKSRQMPLHVALIQVSPPDDFGWMSLGVSVDVALAAAQSAELVIAQVNANMPRVLGRSFLHVNDVDVIVEYDEPIISIGKPPDTESARQIARHVARLIDDGSTLQMSLGATPQAIYLALSEKNDLGIHTQFVSDGIMRLISTGNINNYKKGYNEGKTVASGAVGSQNLYEFLHDNPGIEFYPSDYINNPSVIARHNKMVSLNVAIAIDLTGQTACDALPYNLFAGVTGVMDFVRGAQQAPHGKSILMLPSTTMDSRSSQIVPTLGDTAVVIPRGDVQYVATEYGRVNLFGKSIQERALALISIAHPDFRDELFEQAKAAGYLGPERTTFDAIHGIYPLQLEEERLYGDIAVLFRPSKPVDERMIQEHFYNLQLKDVISRFFHEKTSFVRTDVASASQTDYINNLTILAVAGEPGFEKVIAIGNYFLNDANNLAEVAFSVSSHWQGKGLSSVILRKLTEAAHNNGIQGLVAYTSPQNHNMIKLFKRLPYKIRTTFDGDMLMLLAKFDEPL